MEVIALLLFMMIVGAIIGGATNYLAIKMLFRPYRPLYIGKYRMPFTPGLIPKRRKELAEQTGKIVVEHLLTPQGLQKKLNEPTFKNELLSWAEKEVEKLLKNEEKLSVHLKKIFGDDVDEKLQMWSKKYVEQMYEKKMKQLRAKAIGEALPVSLIEKIDGKVKTIPNYIIERAIAYFESEEGIENLEELINNFLATRGTLGNMIKMFLGNANLVGKVQPEIIKFLKSDGAKEMLQRLVSQEYAKAKQMTVEKVENIVGKEKVVSMLQTFVAKEISLEKWGNKTIAEVCTPFAFQILNNLLPKAVDTIGAFLSNNMNALLERLRLAEIVQEQVESFPLERLEAVVLSISRRELRLITYLGGLLGGIIGIVQGVIVLLFGAN